MKILNCEITILRKYYIVKILNCDNTKFLNTITKIIYILASGGGDFGKFWADL